MEDTQELSENVEMLTLDKEMAEEKAETLQLELDQAKERIEELTWVLLLIKNTYTWYLLRDICSCVIFIFCYTCKQTFSFLCISSIEDMC